MTKVSDLKVPFSFVCSACQFMTAISKIQY